MGRSGLAFVLALAFAAPALAQVKVARAPSAPKTLELAAEQRARFAKTAVELNAAADAHDHTLAAFAAACPRMPKEDPRLPACLDKRRQVLQAIAPYNAALKAYRDEVRAALQGALDAYAAEVAKAQQAIRNLGIATTASAFEEWEKMSKDGKDAMQDEVVGAFFDAIGPLSGAATDRLGKVFEARVSDKLVGPLSLNPWNVNTQIRELEALGVTDPVFHGLLRRIARAKDKRAYVEAGQALFARGGQLYQEGRASYGVAGAEGWRQRNHAIMGACLNFASDNSLVSPAKVVKWAATQSGKMAIGSVKAAFSSWNVAGYALLIEKMNIDMAMVSGLPDRQLEDLKALDARLKVAVERRNAAKGELQAELARFS